MASLILGYARVSTSDQDPSLELDAFRAAGCHRIVEHASGAHAERLQRARSL